MEHASPERWTAAHDALKRRCRCTLSNNFEDAHSLRALLESKNCFLHAAEQALFLLIPRHGAYYDCLYLAADANALQAGLDAMLPLYGGDLPLRASLIGREALVGELSNLFLGQGFTLIKKILRMRNKPPKAKILAAMRRYAEDYRGQASFAEEADAREILEILRENFDLAADNLPELAEIRENIAKRQVALLRADNRIASFHYFFVRHNVYHGVYDVTRREYRGGNGLYFAVLMFVRDYFKSQGKVFTCSISWRDAARQKLVKHAKKVNEVHDGLVICNMLWTPPGADRAHGDARS